MRSASTTRTTWTSEGGRTPSIRTFRRVQVAGFIRFFFILFNCFDQNICNLDFRGRRNPPTRTCRRGGFDVFIYILFHSFQFFIKTYAKGERVYNLAQSAARATACSTLQARASPCSNN